MISVPVVDKPIVITFLAVMSLVLYFFSLNTASHTLNLVGISLLATVSFLIFKRGGWVFLLYAFGLTFALSSGALIELTGIFLVEIQETPYLTGAAARNAFLSSFFLIITYAAYRFFLRLIPKKLPAISAVEQIVLLLLLTVACVAPVYIAATLLAYGSPLSLGMDRFEYFKNIAPPGYVRFYGNIPLLGLIVSHAAYKGVIRHRTCYFWLTFTVGVYIMAGAKFSELFLLGFFFFLPFFTIRSPTIKTTHLIVGVLAILAMAVLVIINYMIAYGTADMFVSRIALQGQMNYALDKITESFQPVSVIFRHFAGVGAQESERGIVYLMYLIAPATTVENMVKHGGTFTAPFPANIGYYFGYYMSPFVIIPFSILAGASSALLTKSVKEGNLVLSVVSAKLFLLIYVAILMGKVHFLLEVKFILFISLVALYLIALTASHTAKLSIS